MVSLNALFATFMVFFAFVGALRGWAKEMLVAFSVILALFLREIVTKFTPLGAIFDGFNPSTQFFVHSLFIIVCAVFGYAGPTLSGAMRGKLARETIQDVMLGTVLGAINGYLIVGTLLYFLDQTGYPFQPLVYPPAEGDPFSTVMAWLAPNWLTSPMIYFAVGIAFIIVIILFV